MILSPRVVAAVLAIAFSSAVASAQVPKPPENVSRTKSDVYKMRSGTVRVKDPDDRAQMAKNIAAIKTVAEWLAYSIASPPFNGEPIPRDFKGQAPAAEQSTMAYVMTEAESFTKLDIGAGNQGKISPEQYEYGEEFGGAVAEAVKVVLAGSSRPIERVNAVRLLSIAARLPSVRVADPLVEIVNNTKVSDAEKLYAFQGLRNLLEQPDQIDPSRNLVRDIALQGRISNALTAYITMKRDDRDKAVVEFVRRHAVAALAQLKVGVVRKPNGELVARPSWTLVRVIEQDPSVTPPFTIQEMIEAGIGLAQMKIDPDMNLDVAAFSMFKLINAMAATANLDSERATRDGTLPILPWKIAAARLSYALSAWREAVKSLPKTRFPDNVMTLAREGIIIMALIERDGVGARTGSEVTALRTWAENNLPKAWAEKKNAILYKDDPNSVLPFAIPAPAAKTETKLATPEPKKTDVVPPKK